MKKEQKGTCSIACGAPHQKGLFILNLTPSVASMQLATSHTEMQHMQCMQYRE
jgi:hypothetical protein